MSKRIRGVVFVFAAIGVSMCGAVCAEKSVEHERRCVEAGGHLGLADEVPACVDDDGAVIR